MTKKMTDAEAPETLRKARSTVKPGEMFFNGNDFRHMQDGTEVDPRSSPINDHRTVRLPEGQTDATGYLANPGGFDRNNVIPDAPSKSHFAGFPMRAGLNGKPAGKAGKSVGDTVRGVEMPNPPATPRNTYQDMYEQNPDGSYKTTGEHSRVSAHAPHPTGGRDASAESEPSYKPKNTDVCSVACNEVMDACSNAMTADNCEEREGHLSRALEMLDAACKGHKSMKGRKN